MLSAQDFKYHFRLQADDRGAAILIAILAPVDGAV
jgi:hypothetical protein